jgi:hypothetical protein
VGKTRKARGNGGKTVTLRIAKDNRLRRRDSQEREHLVAAWWDLTEEDDSDIHHQQDRARGHRAEEET